jgi:folate-binding protein YgfZ
MLALRADAAWALRRFDRLDLTGADRVRFLHNLITCEVRQLAPGSAARGFLTHVKGGVLADADVVAFGDRLRLVLPPGRGGAIRAHLERHRIAERVEIVERGDLVALAVRGARAPEALAALGLPAPEVAERVVGELAGRAVAVRREARGGEPRFELELAAVDRDAIVAGLSGDGAGGGLASVSAAAVECARIEDGELAWGIDYGEENFPQETGEEAAVSYTKGCYLGQEVVARIHYRGGVQRLPRGLRFAGGPPAPGCAIVHGGREAGRVTSVAISPRFGAIGLALAHRRAGEPPAPVELAEGGAARLTELPFGRDDEGDRA